MAKEVAIGKRAKISEAQQYMLLSVLGAAVVLGVAISLVIHFIQQISFNTRVIMAEDEAIVSYSNIIKNTGICKSPKGDVYSDDELKKCDPDSIETSEIPGTLRANILENLAASDALNSVPKEASSSCINPETGKNYTYADLNKIYNNASGATELSAASQLIKSCSALRVIPDALPAFRNEEALLASLNKLFIESGWQPESLSPSGSSSTSTLAPGLNTISVSLSVEADTSTTMNVLDNIERSIREFDIERATIEWGSNNTLTLQAQATAYYMDESTVTETTQTLKAEDK
ncbi:MAG: hypothetical protein Q4C24_02275 [Candidatus Saccharibacteria bacterium]|uniref:Uncharacterized protein n=1 Tax=Candidatus Nanosyncoccus alces TaxID=2171997 RepID=A0ABY0FP30_9BACT|nr:hypothetical protein [Candidatus Nanosyncoccus alces]MDO4399097.1 hypothetical protein [Candidatus Saccharibacteria bacterium]RYC75013.1 hypothetical protein G3RUM_00294 [Candidatus Nanosyncoccus alces]